MQIKIYFIGPIISATNLDKKNRHSALKTVSRSHKGIKNGIILVFDLEYLDEGSSMFSDCSRTKNVFILTAKSLQIDIKILSLRSMFTIVQQTWKELRKTRERPRQLLMDRLLTEGYSKMENANTVTCGTIEHLNLPEDSEPEEEANIKMLQFSKQCRKQRLWSAALIYRLVHWHSVAWSRCNTIHSVLFCAELIGHAQAIAHVQTKQSSIFKFQH